MSLRMGAGLPRWLTRIGFDRPRFVLGLWLILLLAAVPGVTQLSIETSTESVLDRSDPAWEFYQRSQRIFGGDEVITILIEGDEPFDPKALREVRRISSALRGTPGVRRVDSLSTVPLIEEDRRGGVSLGAAVADRVPTGVDERKRLQDRVSSDGIAPRLLVSEEGGAFAVNLQLRRNPEEHYARVLERINSVAGRSVSAVSGVPIFRREADRRTRSDLIRFIPWTVAIIAVGLGVGFLSARAAIVPLLCGASGSWIVLGSMGTLGRPVTISTVILPSVLLAIGCAYGIHLVAAARSRGGNQKCRIAAIASPIALSGMTTVVGFVALSFVRIDAIEDIGRFGALGVLAVMLATLTAGPALIRTIGLGRRSSQRERRRVVQVSCVLTAIGERARYRVVGAWVLIACVAGVGLVQLRVETDVVKWFSEEAAVRESYERIRDVMSGISPLNVVVESEGKRSVSDPEVVRRIGRLARYVESFPSVGKTLSIATPLEQLHGVFAEEDGREIPSEATLIEQYLVLLNSKLQMGDLISPDRRLANILVRADHNGSDALRDIARRAENWWAREGVEGFRANTTGIMYEFARAQDEIAYGQLRGLLFAFVVVGGVLAVLFRSVWLTVAGLLPNVMPLVVIFGIMGLLSIPLDAGTVLIGNLAFGIAVDDTIHTLTAYDRRRRAGWQNEDAVKGALSAVLPALVATTLVVGAGFAVLGGSGFLLTRRMGLLTAGVVIICLVADLLLLPALLGRGEGRGVSQGERGVGGSYGKLKHCS